MGIERKKFMTKLIRVEGGFRCGERFISAVQRRAIQQPKPLDIGEKGALFSVSSESPYYRWWLDANEILSHEAEAVDLSWFGSGRAPFLYNHDRNFYLGIVRSAVLESKETLCEVDFKERGQAGEIVQDLKDGYLGGATSVGYEINELELRENEEEREEFVVTKWKILEASLVTIPADESVGYMGYQEEDKKQVFSFASKSNNSEEKPLEIKEEKVTEEDFREQGADPNVAKQESSRRNAIESLCQKFEVPDHKKRDFIDEGASIPQVMEYCTKNHSDATPTAAPSGFLSKKERKQYRLLNVLKWQLGQIPESEVGLEKEVSGYIESVTGKPIRDGKALYVPTYELNVRAGLNTTTTAQGGATIDTELDVSNFTRELLNRTLIFQMGARLLTGLQGPVDIPIEDDTPTVYWIGEGGLIPESTSKFELASLRMKEAAAITPITQRMMLQSSLDMEAYIRDILVRKIAIELDRAVINGKGTENEPLGLLNYPGLLLGSVGTNGGEIGWDQIVDICTALALKNAEGPSCGFLTNPKVRAHLQKKQKFAGDTEEIWSEYNRETGMGMLANFPAGVTNQVPSNFKKGNSGNKLSALIFAQFADIVAGEYGVMEVLANPFGRGFYNNMVDIKATIGFDVTFVRDSVSFAAYKDVLAESGSGFTRQG